MSEWKVKRFWKTAAVEPVGDSWQVLLDGRQVRTPAKSVLLLPSEALAVAVAEEWQNQDEKIDPRSMPVTRTANSAIDKVRPQRAAVAEMLVGYGGSDLLCYRAVTPEELAARQAAEWDPVLDWAEQRFGARLASTAGVMPVAQDPDALRRLAEPVHAMDPFRLAAFHDLVALSGSLLLAFAVVEGRMDVAEAWRVSRIDEDWQIELWGKDDEAEAAAAVKERAFHDAARFWHFVGPTTLL